MKKLGKINALDADTKKVDEAGKMTDTRRSTGQSHPASDEDQNQKPPDTVAVALTYDPESADDAPVVAAKGEGYLAERIIETAREAGVPIRSDADLVEILAATEIGDEIPVEAFIAVAEILRYVYALNGRMVPTP